jgi:dTDP-4-amino-4,6-dideoxygalactose transaminase
MVEYEGSHILSNGPIVEMLEEAIREMYDVEHVIAVSSCTQGLLMISYFPEMRFNTPAFTWKSINTLARIRGYKPHYIDINPKTWLMKPITKGPIGTIANHTFGNISYVSEREHVIYDGAHALGADLQDIGMATVFSLAPTKLVTSCEGGLILTNDDELGKLWKETRDYSCRMSEPHAHYGLYTLTMLEEILEWKRSCYEYYKKELPGIFQEIPNNSNYNTIGMLTNLKIPPHIECKKYYEPLSFEEHLKATKYVYNKIVCLPSWFGCDIEKVVHDILEYNEDLENGRIKETGKV